MRHSILIALPLLALAACGRPGLDKADGSFDRAAFRELYAGQCTDQTQRIGVPGPDAGRICGCLTDRLIATSSDDELRTYHRDDRVPASKIQSLTEQCQHVGPGRAQSSLDVPEEPPPDGLQPIIPPPTAPATPGMELADGPDAGTGASAPGGSRARVSPLSSYLTPDDYPAAALRNNQQGRVTVILDVDPSGRVANCSVAATSGSASLDSATCRIMRSRPRYTPARNARGVAVADRDLAIVRWQLPSG